LGNAKRLITYIPMPKGFFYLVAIMDWASRRVLSWRLQGNRLNGCELGSRSLRKYDS